ncbi:hypothetical protein Droror1_Dr00007566 [Drosera rotundifolia]
MVKGNSDTYSLLDSDSMDDFENDKVPMLLERRLRQQDADEDSQFHKHSATSMQPSTSVPEVHFPSYLEDDLIGEAESDPSEHAASCIQLSCLGNKKKFQESRDSCKFLEQNNKARPSDSFSKYCGTNENQRRGKDRVKNEQPSDTHPEIGIEGSKLFHSMILAQKALESYRPEKTTDGTEFIQINGLTHYISAKGSLTRSRREALDGFLSYDENDRNSFTDKENLHLKKSGRLGMCDHPYCTSCPTHCHDKNAPRKQQRRSDIFDPKFRNTLYGGAKGWARRLCSFVLSWIPVVMNPHTKEVQQWNQFFVISCLVSIFVDPLFFFLLYVLQADNCIVLDFNMTQAVVVFRSFTDFIYFLHILLQFRLAYVAPESKVVGAGVLVDHPKKIACHYLKGYFMIDLFAVLPLPQIIVLCILPHTVRSSANYAKNALRSAILVQYMPRLYRFLPLIGGQSPSGFIFESAWANFVINLLTFILAGHVVGSCWYLFGLQRVNQCLRDACGQSGIPNCMRFTDCTYGDTNKFHSTSDWKNWTKNVDASACFNPSNGSFAYGIYVQAVGLTTERSVVGRYVYSLFWGFQQISTLAGNLIPSYFVGEVLFTMAIIGLGLLLFALLIGNMQNFLQSLGRRRLEMSLRQRDVEQWMNHRRMPEDLKKKVREAERYSWVATRGVNERTLMENLPEDLQREIRRHLFNFVTKVHMFFCLKENVLDAICERLRQKTYITGSIIMDHGLLIDKMVFIVRGRMESIGEDGFSIPLSEGHVCGEELLIWRLEQAAANQAGKKGKYHGARLLSNRMVTCCTNVEAFLLKAGDLEEVATMFERELYVRRVRGAIRYASPYWRSVAAVRIQIIWRYRRRRKRLESASHICNGRSLVFEQSRQE